MTGYISRERCFSFLSKMNAAKFNPGLKLETLVTINLSLFIIGCSLSIHSGTTLKWNTQRA